jgi:hypothetical protein
MIHIIYFFFMIGNNCFHKLRCIEYLELTFRCLLDVMCIELTCMNCIRRDHICLWKCSYDNCVSDF